MTAHNPFAFRPYRGLRRGIVTEVPLPTRLVSNEELEVIGKNLSAAMK